MRDRLRKLILESEILCHTCGESTDSYCAEALADYLIKNGVIVTPCVAMVEQFIKNGKFDKKRTCHNGKYAVVYVDESKWNCPLIDITEQSYNAEKAEERIQALK